MICIWNWESESLLTIIKLEVNCLRMHSLCFNKARLLVALLDDGEMQLYEFDKERTAKFIN